MRLTLDLDDINKSSALKKLGLLKVIFPGKEIELWRSASGKGFHLIVYGLKNSFEEIINMRFMLGDDIRRIHCDVIRNHLCMSTNVLFLSKVKNGQRIYATQIV